VAAAAGMRFAPLNIMMIALPHCLRFGSTAMRRSQTALFAVALLAGVAPIAQARVWTDSSGQYTVDADLIAFNEKTVVLERKEDRQLGAVPIEKLSQSDREYLQSKEAQEAASNATGGMQTWTLVDGTKISGRVVSYARRNTTLQRRRGRMYVNDRAFDNLPEIYQILLPRIVAQFETINRPDKDGLEAWLIRQKGQPRSFTIDGVVMEFENGDEYVIPFFVFSNEDLKVLQPGWEAWLAAHQGQEYEQQEDQSFLLQSAAAARQANDQMQRQIALMQLNQLAQQTTLEAVQSGVISLWEVTLYPSRGTAGPPLWVVLPGRTSMDAMQQALAQNAGYIAGAVRRINRF
jgi:hypothetical protein